MKYESISRRNRSSRRYGRKMKWGGAGEDSSDEESKFSCSTCTCTKCFQLEAHIPTEGLSPPVTDASSPLLPIDNIQSMMVEQQEDEKAQEDSGDSSTDEKEKEGGKKKKKKKSKSKKSTRRRYKKRTGRRMH